MRKRSCLQLLIALCFLFNNFELLAQLTISGSSATTSITASSATVVSPDISITSSQNITDFTVSIIDSYSTNDQLGYTGILPSGVTAGTWNTTTRSIVFKGTKTASEWQEFLRRVTITTGEVCSPETRKVSFAAGETYYNPLNGHFYRLIATISSWTDAQNTASNTSYYGREGYLVTLTSDVENTFVSRLIGEDSWMGLSDDHEDINDALGYLKYDNDTDSEGKFYWVTGPEKGIQVTTGNSPDPDNEIPGIYQNWGSGEPNDAAGIEDHGHMFADDGRWNDIPDEWTVNGIMEFGDMPNDITVSVPQFTKDIFIEGSSGGSISGGDVTVCADANTTTLSLNGLTGTVVRWESSTNNFIVTGTPIANTTTSLNVTNISETTYYRAVVNSTSPSSCNGLVTSSTVINVLAPQTGNIFAENTTICAGADVELYVSGQTGTVQKWQRSTDNTNWTDIANTTTTLVETVASTGTQYYRVVIENAGCSTEAVSTSKEITIVSGTAPEGGQVSSATHGSTANSGTLTLTGQTGTVVKWQQSSDDGVIWSDISNTTNTYDYSNIVQTTLFRAQLTNGSCGTSFSDEGSVTILSPPTITSFTPTSAGEQYTVVITGTNFDGASQITFGGTSASSFIVDSSTQITAVVDNGATGNVVVTTAGGTATAGGFTFIPAGFTVSETTLTLDEDTGTDTFTVVLDSRPIGDVVLDITSDDTGEATVDSAQLTFTNENWDTPQTVLVTGIDDPVVADDTATITISIDAALSDNAFDALGDETVQIILTNDDADFTIDTISNTAVDENIAYTSETPSLSGDTPLGTLTYTLGGTDAARFTINSATGVVTMAARNFEVPVDDDTDNIYELTIMVTDDEGNSDTEDWTVTVEDVMEAVNFTFDAIADVNVAENTAYAGVTPNLSGDVPIGDVIYSLAGVDSDDFSIDTATGVVSMIARDFENPTDSNTNSIYLASIVATDADGNTAALSWEVTVTDVTETVSFTVEAIANETIEEETPYVGPIPSILGTPVGNVIYTVGGADAAIFSHDSATGQVFMPLRSFENPDDVNEDNTYEVIISATDEDGNSASEDWTITLLDVIEPSDFTINLMANVGIDENTAYTSAIPSLTGNPIGNVTFTLGGPDATNFTIDGSTGVVSAVARDFESPEDSDTDNVYEITITAADDDDNSDSASWSISIQNLNEGEPDTDGDGIPDPEDEDDDGDGTPDVEDDFPMDPNEDTDTDGDGIGDNTDLDIDGDGVPNTEDVFPNDPGKSEDANDNDSLPEVSEPLLIPAEAITPNGDGINENWVVPGIENYENAKVTVYNRWGHEVFAVVNYRNDWQGNHGSSSERLPSGSYLYVIDLGNGSAAIRGWLFINY